MAQLQIWQDSEQEHDQYDYAADSAHEQVGVARLRFAFDHPAVPQVPAERGINNIQDGDSDKQEREDDHQYQPPSSIILKNATEREKNCILSSKNTAFLVANR